MGKHCTCEMFVHVIYVFVLYYSVSICRRTRFRASMLNHTMCFPLAHRLPGAFAVYCNIFATHTQAPSEHSQCTPFIPQPVTQLCNLGGAAAHTRNIVGKKSHIASKKTRIYAYTPILASHSHGQQLYVELNGKAEKGDSIWSTYILRQHFYTHTHPDTLVPRPVPAQAGTSVLTATESRK